MPGDQCFDFIHGFAGLFRTKIEKIHAISGGEHFYIGDRRSQFEQTQYIQIGNGMNLVKHQSVLTTVALWKGVKSSLVFFFYQ